MAIYNVKQKHAKPRMRRPAAQRLLRNAMTKVNTRTTVQANLSLSHNGVN
tara:strand:+ start:273 stop:422 length:150 start_codon:yes stop_codon:yes gene_type:complete